MHSTAEANALTFNLKGFAVGNGCTDPLECEFQNDYGVYQMVLYRDLGFISQEQYEQIEGKCSGHGADLPDDCTKLMDEVQLALCRLIL